MIMIGVGMVAITGSLRNVADSLRPNLIIDITIVIVCCGTYVTKPNLGVTKRRTMTNSLSLVRMARPCSKATEKDTNARVKLLSETLMGLYWVLSGL